MNVRRIWDLFKKAISSWSADYAPSMGAALSYYTLFSIAPLLLIVIAVAGFFFGADEVRGALFAQLGGLMGDEGAKAIEEMLETANRPREGLFSTISGFAVLLVGATTVFGELQNSLDRIWRAPARDPSSGLLKLIRARLLSFGMILAIAFLLLVSLAASAMLAALGKWWDAWFGAWEILAHILNFAVSFGLVTVLFALIYKIIPRVDVAWHDVWVGAAVTSLLFTIGKFLIGLYLGKSDVASGFGAAGSLVIVMVWVYYSTQIFLVGAEFTWVYAHEYGSRKGMPRPGALSKAEEKPAESSGDDKPRRAQLA
ncbi:MAG: YihY/virulence factor BrkB family protein [Burkholderiales bacterium]